MVALLSLPGAVSVGSSLAGVVVGRPRIIPQSAVLLPDVVLLRSAPAGAGVALCRLVASEGFVIAVSFERSAPHLGVAMVSPVESNAGPCGTRRAFMVTRMSGAADRGAAGRSEPGSPGYPSLRIALSLSGDARKWQGAVPAL